MVQRQPEGAAAAAEPASSAPASASAAPASADAAAAAAPQPLPAQFEDPYGMHLAAEIKPNETGLPGHLKAGIEALSGLSLDDVQVHYNSPKPAQLNALAYAQGSEIFVGPGQERHLPHEAWHVVQQRQGRVRPTMQMKDEVPINDDDGLEREADEMGAKAAQLTPDETRRAAPAAAASLGAPVAQRLKGAPGSAQAGKAVPFTLHADFKRNHVANDLAGAKQVTEARVASGAPAGIVAGTAANHVATEAAWTAAIAASPEIVPPDDQWDGTVGGDDGQFANQLAKVEVQGWEAQGTAGNVAAKTATLKKFVGGTWSVAGCEFDAEENYKSGTGRLDVDISHLTS